MSKKIIGIFVKIISTIAALYFIGYGIYYFITLKSFMPYLMWFALAILLLSYQWIFRNEYANPKKKEMNNIITIICIIFSLIFIVLGIANIF